MGLRGTSLRLLAWEKEFTSAFSREKEFASVLESEKEFSSAFSHKEEIASAFGVGKRVFFGEKGAIFEAFSLFTFRRVSINSQQAYLLSIYPSLIPLLIGMGCIFMSL